MGLQTYIITPRDEFTSDNARDLLLHVRRSGGYVLMVMNASSVIAIDDSQMPVIARHPQVSFIGPVTLNPNGIAARMLQNLFAQNLSRQIDPGGGETAQGP
jgi:hypothetical protein